MIRRFLLCLLILGVSAALADGKQYPSLWDCADQKLQQQLEAIIVDLGYAEAVDRGTLSVALVDISDLHQPRVAAVNGDTMVYAASLPKLAILLGAFVEIRDGRMTLDQETRESLTRMIRLSSNVQATQMLNRVGKTRLLDILQSDEFKLYDPDHGGGLWVGKEYGRSQAYQRDPLHNLSHGATAMQTARFYYLLETDQIVDEALSDEMKAILGDPGINHKFVRGLESFPEAKIYRKSGSWKQWHADSALIETGPTAYILVALAEDVNAGEWLRQLIEPIHTMMITSS